MLRKIVLITSVSILCITSFLGGVYVGSVQGVLYSLGLEAHKAKYRIFEYEAGEVQKGEFKAKAELIIDSNISFFGQHLEEDWLTHKIPSPWSLSEPAFDFMRSAVEYRIENPRKNEKKIRSILDPEGEEAFIKSHLNAMGDKNGELSMSKEENMKRIKESLRYKQEREIYYQRAMKYFRNSKEKF